MPGSRRVHAWVSESACLGLGGCMPGSRRVHAWVSEGACLGLNRHMNTEKNKEKKKKVKKPQNCTLSPQLTRAPRQGSCCLTASVSCAS